MVDVKFLSDKDLETLYNKIITEKDIRIEKKKEAAFKKAIELMGEFNELCNEYDFCFAVEDYSGYLEDGSEWVRITGLRKI